MNSSTFAQLDLFALQFAQASAGCVGAGLLLLALLIVAARRWPSLRAARAPWLLAQLLCVAALALAMLPQRAAVSVVPRIELTAAPLPRTSPVLAMPALPLTRDAELTAPAPPSAVQWSVVAARAWCALYLAGLLVALLRLLQGARAVRALLALAVRDDGAVASPLAVYHIDLPVSPMLLKVFKPVLLLPRHVAAGDAARRALILAHEHAHLARRDPLWRQLALLAQALLWFNPAMRGLLARLAWAQEAGCDRAVLATRGAAERRQYASALVEQLRRQQPVHGGIGAALAFSGAAISVVERLRLIRDGAGASAGPLVRGALLAGGALAVGAVLAVQPAYAWRAALLAADADAVAAAAPVRWQAPLAEMRVSSAFGVVAPRRTHPHDGVDLRARRGTPVLAVADGVVDSSLDVDPGGAKYGKTVTLLHADGRRSFYAHLDARQVVAGQAVRAGQPIGRSGATGKVSGPHLHFEVRKAGGAIDPARLPGLMAPG